MDEWSAQHFVETPTGTHNDLYVHGVDALSSSPVLPLDDPSEDALCFSPVAAAGSADQQEDQVGWDSVHCQDEIGEVPEVFPHVEISSYRNVESSDHISMLKKLDPFHPWIDDEAALLVIYLKGGSGETTTKLSLPQLRAWRRAGREIWLLAMRLPTDGSPPDQYHAWPRSLVITINDKEVLNVIPPTNLKKRRDTPLELSSMVKPVDNNEVKASWFFPRRDNFILVFALTLRLTPDDLFKKVRQQPLQCSATQLDRVRGLLAEDSLWNPDEIMCSSRRRLSLMCPISFMRIEVPARGQDCRHIQCFDLSAYLSSNHRMASLAKRWQCAVCSHIVRPADLVIDGFNTDVLQGAPCDVESVVLDHVGNWCLDVQVDGQQAPSEEVQKVESSQVDPPMESPEGWPWRTNQAATFIGSGELDACARAGPSSCSAIAASSQQNQDRGMASRAPVADLVESDSSSDLEVCPTAFPKPRERKRVLKPYMGVLKRRMASKVRINQHGLTVDLSNGSPQQSSSAIDLSD